MRIFFNCFHDRFGIMASAEEPRTESAHIALFTELEDGRVSINRKIQIVDRLREESFGSSTPPGQERSAAVASLCKVTRGQHTSSNVLMHRSCARVPGAANALAAAAAAAAPSPC